MTRFPVGKLVVTLGIQQLIDQHAFPVMEYVDRHAQGDWGNVLVGDYAENELAVEMGDRVLSVYAVTYDEQRIEFFVITEADRSVTTVLLKSEY